MKNKLEDKTTYSINSDFKMECPLCKEMIPVGYAKPIGLVQLQGKKKCRVTCEKNQKKANIPCWQKKKLRQCNRFYYYSLLGSKNHCVPPIIVPYRCKHDHSHSDDFLNPHKNALWFQTKDVILAGNLHLNLFYDDHGFWMGYHASGFTKRRWIIHITLVTDEKFVLG